MKKYKSLISLLLIVGMLLSMSVFPAYAAERITVNLGKANLVKINPEGTDSYTVYNTLIEIGSKVKKTFEYKVNVPVAGSYHMSLDGLLGQNGKMEITVAGKVYTLNKSITARQEIYIGKVELNAGDNSLIIKNVGSTLLELRNLIFEQAGNRVETDFSRTTGAYKNYYIPTIIEAEDYDLGDSGSYTMNLNQAETRYRGTANLNVTEKSNGTNVITMNATEWANYTFTAPTDGSYNVAVNTNAEGTMEMFFDDCEYPITFSTVVGETPVANVYLKKGQHVFKLRSADTQYEVDYIAFTAASSKGYAPEDLGTKPLTEEELEAIKSVVRPVWKEIWVDAAAKANGDGTKANPYKTIEEAKAKVREIRNDMQGDIVVKILPGEYHIAEMIKFDENDGGKDGYRVIYQGANALEKPLLTGGTRVTNWEPHEKGVWKASVPQIEDMRTLYINGFAGVRARSKYIYNFGAEYDDPSTEPTFDGYTVSKLNLPVLSNAADVEICFNALWTLQRVAVKEIIDADETHSYVVCDQPHFNNMLGNYNGDVTPLAGSKGYFENAYELIDEYGEFYFDKGRNVLYYYPYPEEDLKTADVYAGTTEFMFEIFGSDINTPVEGLCFDNLDIRHGTWLDVSRTGLSTFQADCLIDENNPASKVQSNGKTMPAVMQVRRARDINVTNCNFQNVGCSAIFMDEHVKDSVIDGNVFRDLSGTAVSVGTWRTSGLTADNLCENIEITNNVMHRIGLDYAGSPAVGVYYSRGVKTEHNDIKDTPYSGITYGWGWGSQVPIRLGHSGHSISYNRIEDNSNVVKDGGPIYNLGDAKNTYIEKNYLIDSRDFGGIYFDSGSAMITCRYNVLEDMQQSGIFGAGSKSYGMTIKTNWSNNKNQKRKTFEATDSDIEVPIVCENGWPQEALDVIANAGLKRGYKRLLGGIEYPSWRTEFWEFENAVNQFYKSVNIVERDAVDWMPGGEGVAYHETKAGTTPKTYALGLNTSVGDSTTGEWLKYEIEIPKDGYYQLELVYSYLSSSGEANVASDSGVYFYIDDEMVVDRFMLPSTGSWNAYLPINVGEPMFIKGGKHIVKVEFYHGWAFQKFSFTNVEFRATEPEFDDGVMLK